MSQELPASNFGKELDRGQRQFSKQQDKSSNLSHIQQLVQKYKQIDPSNSNTLKQNRMAGSRYEDDFQDAKASANVENPAYIYEDNESQSFQPTSIIVSQSKGNDKILLVNNADPAKMQIEYAGTGFHQVVNLTTPQQKQFQGSGKMLKGQENYGLSSSQTAEFNSSKRGFFLRQQQFSQSVKYQQAQLNGNLSVSKYQVQLSGQPNRFSTKVKSNMRPLSAKPQQNNFSHQISQQRRDRYHQEQQSQTLQNDYQQIDLNQKKLNTFISRLNTKNQIGSPYMQTIKQAHLQNYGITQYYPKTLQNSNTVASSISATLNPGNTYNEQEGLRQRKVRPLSSKPTFKSQLNDSDITSQQVQLNQNSFISYPGEESQSAQLQANLSPSNHFTGEKSSFFVNLNINQDREQLYKAGITLKKELNKYFSENSQLKTQLQFLHKELQNREKMLTEVVQTGKLQNRSNDNTLLSMKLKQQLREIQQLLKQREAELELAKRNLRTTKLEEREITLKTFVEEAQRLRNSLLQSEQRNLNLLVQIEQLNNSKGQQTDQQIAKDKNNARSVLINDQAMLELNRVTERMRSLEELLQGKEKETQLWKSRCEKEMLKNQKLQPGTNDSHQKGLKDKSGKTREQFVTKDELNHVKQKVVDIQLKYDNLLVENQELIEVKQALEENIQQQDNKVVQLQNSLKKAENEIKQLYSQIQNTDEEIKSLKKSINISASQDKSQISKQLKELADQHQEHLKNLEQQYQDDASHLKVYIEELESQLRQTEARANSLTLQLEINEQKVRAKPSRQQTHINSEALMSDMVNQAQGSVKSNKQESKKADSLNKMAFVKEEEVKQIYEKVRKNLQLHRIPKEQISNYLFDDSLENREDISIKEFSSLLYMKFSLEKSEALNLARFIIEQPSSSVSGVSQLSQFIEYNEGKTMMNRRIVKFIQDKILGNQYQVYSEDQERLAIKKYQELALNNEDDIEQTLGLYVEDDKGLVTVNDLKECLTSYEIFDGRDKQSFECVSLHLLRMNYNNTSFLRIQDALDVLFPNRSLQQKAIRKSQDDQISGHTSNSYIKSAVGMSQSRHLDIQSANQQSNSRYSVKDSQLKGTSQEFMTQNSKIQMSEKYIEDEIGEVQSNIRQSKTSYSKSNLINSGLMKSMNEEEIMEQSELAFQMIANRLQQSNHSLRNILRSHLYDRKIAILKSSHNQESEANLEQEVVPNQDTERTNKEAIDKTFEVINAQDFFRQLNIKELDSSLQECIVQVAAKPLKDQQSLNSVNTQMIFIYKDLEEILSAYGLEDATKPRNSKNLNYDKLDQKSIRIMNRLADYITQEIHRENSESDINSVFRTKIFKDKIYQKTINNSQLGGKKQFRLEFVRSREFFEILQKIGVRKSDEPHKNLVEFLNIDSKLYKSGLVYKKIVKLTQECVSNEYLRSIGAHRKHRDSKQIPEKSQQIQEIDEDVAEDIQDSVADQIISEKEDQVINQESIDENYEEDNFINEDVQMNSGSRNDMSPIKVGSNLKQSTFEEERSRGYPKIVEEPRISQLLGQSEYVRTSNASLNSPLKEDRNLKQIVSIDESHEFALRKKGDQSKSRDIFKAEQDEVIVNQYSDSENESQ